MVAVKTFLGVVLITLSLAWVVGLHSYFGLALFSEQFIALALGLSLALTFLSKPLAGDRAGPVDIAVALLVAAVLLFVAFDYERLLGEFVKRSPEINVLGGVIVVALIEAVRRTSGRFLLLVILCLLAYAMVGHLVPPPLTAREIDPLHLISYLGFDPSAVMGNLLRITITVVVPFVLLGQVLVRSGGGEFFTDLALAAVGRHRGGAAKVSIVSSAVFGSVSGSAVSNVATTGIVTIPLMQRSGLTAKQASAIEVSASTGAQLMPPIMGAAAFLMAEFLDLAYTQVVVAGLAPAFLYYLSIFVQVDLLARSRDVAAPSVPGTSLYRILRRGWQFVGTIFLLFIMLFAFQMAPESAAVWALIALIAVGMVQGYAGGRLTVRATVEALTAAGASAAELIVLVAAAGMVIGILNATGGGFALTLLLIQLAGTHTVVLLAVAALICIVFGMGMPTTGVYVLLSVLVAPALVETGVDVLAAHFFVLYLGMMSMITPPLGLATFPASIISGVDATRIGVSAARLSWTAYLVPFLFVISPTLIMQGSVLPIIVDVATAGCGILLVSVSVAGRRRALWARLLLLGLGVFAMLPEGVLPYGKTITLSSALIGVAMLCRLDTGIDPEPAEDGVQT